MIEAYKLGGFPTLVLEAKQDYVNRYGLESGYWAQNERGENAAVDEYLKENLNDLAQYSHAQAQENGKIEDYQQAAHYYRKYLDYFPNEEGSANTNFLLAEILFESKVFDQAAVEYERTAYATRCTRNPLKRAMQPSSRFVNMKQHWTFARCRADSEWHARISIAV